MGCWVLVSALEMGARRGTAGTEDFCVSNRPLDHLTFITESYPLAHSSQAAMKGAFHEQRSCTPFSPKDLFSH